jgi:O-antigen/teichoic acid export membrane protein
VTDEPTRLSPSERAGERAALNTVTRAVGEIVGKLASLVLFAALAREVGESELGVYVFAFAWAQIATIPIGLGFDRYVLRRFARERFAVHELFFNVITLKLLRSVPVTAISFAAVSLLGYDAQTRTAVYILTLGLLLDSTARTLFATFNAFERGTLVAATVVVQRFAAAGLGLLALAAGGGVIAVSATFTVGTAVGLGLGFLLMRRSIGIPRASLDRERQRELRQVSRGYAVQDVLGTLLAKLDAVLLSLLATNAAVGRYGAAYRLLEATFFLSSAVNGAFAAMYAYLERDTRPTIRAAFERSVKLALAALVPCAVAFGVLAEPFCRLFFGKELENAAEPLRLLAPAMVFLGLVTLSSSLLISRRRPAVLVRIMTAAVILNVALNLALIPGLDGNGAAAAMLITAAVLAGLVLFEAVRTVGGVSWGAMVAGPLAAGAAMALPVVALEGTPALALAAGVAAYGAVLFLVERTLNPGDLRFVLAMLRRRWGPGRARA